MKTSNVSNKNKLTTIYVPLKKYNDYHNKLYHDKHLLSISRTSLLDSLKETDVKYLIKIGCSLLRLIDTDNTTDSFFLADFDYSNIPKMVTLSDDGLVIDKDSILIYDDWIE